MKPYHIGTLIVGTLALSSSSAVAGDTSKHLFILSGQSNMQGHRPNEAFSPLVEETLGKDNVIVVQDAMGGQPIQRWYKDWSSPTGAKSESPGELYDRLMGKVKAAIGKRTNSAASDPASELC